MIQNPDPRGLSPAGVHRREEILRAAVGAAGRRRMRRYATRAMAVVLIGLGTAIMMTRQREHRVPPELVQQTSKRPEAEVTPMPVKREITITRIETDPLIAQRLAIPAQSPTWKMLSDDELVRQLASAGRPAGLQYIKGKPELLWR